MADLTLNIIQERISIDEIDSIPDISYHLSLKGKGKGKGKEKGKGKRKGKGNVTTRSKVARVKPREVRRG